MHSGRLLLILLSLLIAGALYGEEGRILRFPSTNGKQIVFSHGGDLFTVPMSGGLARRLTSDEGFESFSRFSADGKWLAFTGQYDGNTEVYLIPAEGGEPKRLTYTATLGRDDVGDRMGPNNVVMAWKNQSNEIIFRSRMRSFNSFIGQLYGITPEAGMPNQLPVPRGGFLSFSPDDSKMAYNQVFREFRTWKRYKGGMADDIWIYDFKSGTTEQITTNKSQDIIPMWHGDNIYFISDRDSRMNLYQYSLSTKQTTQLTQFTDFDIKFPSLGKDNIVFEKGGYLYRYDLNGKQVVQVPVVFQEDFPGARSGLVEVGRSVSNYEISPDGKRALFGARGDVFTVPAEHGITRNLTRTPGVHERDSKWSPDGKYIAYISDQTGENEIYIQAQDGRSKAVQLTKNADTYYYQISWSPDSKNILWGDKKLRLRYVDINTKKVTEVDQAKAWEIRQYAWSPDSKWIAYTRPEWEAPARVYLYSLETGKATPATSAWYASNSPAFSDDGKFLVFASSRDFNPIYSWTEWNHAYQDMERVYLMALAKDTPSPFALKNDEVKVDSGAKAEEKKDDKKKDEKSDAAATRVDLDGLSERVVGLEISPSSYGNLAMVGGNVYYGRNGSGDERPQLLMYDPEKKKETELGQINGYEISADHKKMLVSSSGSYAIIDLPKSKIDMKDKLDLSNMEVNLDRKSEWKQIYHEAWRQMRDFFYAPNMHGVDWVAMRDRYAPLVEHVHHRDDLTYIMGELMGELNVGHAYVGGGERPSAPRLSMGLLGAEMSRDASGYFRIDKILSGENWDNGSRSPLTELGVGVSEGDYILAINGQPVDKMNNIYQGLINTAGKEIFLTVNSKPNSTGSREVLVKPLRDESGLYYYNWVRKNIEYVNKKTNGKVGYIHIPDMGVNGLNEFVKHYYPQLSKKALIVDVRGNGGGNVSPMIIERLRREVAMIDISRNVAPSLDPGGQIWGPMVCLVNEYSASDGDLFTYRFKKHKLGTVIGKRSWGGTVGIRGSLPLLDGGSLTKPEFSRYDEAGKEWIIEGYGVDPDIEVINDPATEFKGVDQQLDKAIEVITGQMKTDGKQIPPAPPYPVR